MLEKRQRLAAADVSEAYDRLFQPKALLEFERRFVLCRVFVPRCCCSHPLCLSPFLRCFLRCGVRRMGGKEGVWEMERCGRKEQRKVERGCWWKTNWDESGKKFFLHNIQHCQIHVRVRVTSHGGATLELTNLHMHNLCQTTHVQRTVGGGELVRNVDHQEKSCKNDVVQTSPSKLKILKSIRVKTIALASKNSCLKFTLS